MQSWRSSNPDPDKNFSFQNNNLQMISLKATFPLKCGLVEQVLEFIPEHACKYYLLRIIYYTVIF